MWLTDNEKKALKDFREKNKKQDKRKDIVKNMWLSNDEIQMILKLRSKNEIQEN